MVHMALGPEALKKLFKSIDSIFDILNKIWEISHIMNASTSRNDKKQQLRCSMDQLNVCKMGIMHIQDDIGKIVGEEDGST